MFAVEQGLTTPYRKKSRCYTWSRAWDGFLKRHKPAVIQSRIFCVRFLCLQM